ncbi:Gfo/Idh/MocA family oxidoreductase [Planococcus sp. ISL-109]|nr:Gfo/Idh/MocA family oxidoreductase [Planococcus sp. ISL-109]MBT2581763.1 Gfo/Idh/MocA family oxidoreductase [Planococcus sp. ISL-109]
MISIGIIGAGIVGERIIKQTMEETGVDIQAVYDTDSERLKYIEKTYHLPVTDSLEELFQAPIDWVYIGTPPKSHAELAETAARRGLNVLCEKPLAHDAAAGEVMAESAVNNRIHTAMHFPLMYSPVVREMALLIKSGDIGKVRRVELHTVFPEWPRAWQQNPWIASRSQGGFVREVFPHYLQLMHRLFGTLEITAHQVDYPEEIEKCETGIVAYGQTQQGAPFLLSGLSAVGQQELLQFKVYGEDGVLTLENWSHLYREELGNTREEVKTDRVVPSLFAEMKEQSTFLVGFDEGLVVQRYIDQLLTK